MKKLLAAALALCMAITVMTACGGKAEAPAATPRPYPKQMGQVKAADTYTENKVLLWNDETQRKIECLEVVPADLSEGEKIPVIIYIHGLNGNAESLIDEPEALAADKIAGFTFECGNSKIDGKTVTPAHYTSRVSDFETVIAYVKTLPYVDPDRLYIYGQSYGGLVAMAAAPKHNDDTAGMILESTGLDEGGSLIRANDKPGLSQYELPEDWKSYVKQYSKDIIICCAEGDAGAYANGQVTAGVYEERDTGKVTFYSCPEGKHSFAAFSEEGKAVTLNAIRELVLH